jgi:hypothetical protein
MPSARHGDVLENARTEKARITLHRTGEDTGGALLEMEAEYAPGGEYPPDHLHPLQDEHFVVLRGALRVRLAGTERTNARGVPGLLQLAVTLRTFRDEFVLCSMPTWALRLLVPPLALLGRLCGLRGDDVSREGYIARRAGSAP